MADQIRYAHGEIKAANGVDYVMDDEIIKHNGVKLKDVVNAAQTALNSKTDKSYVDSELAKKADAAALNGKADASVVAQLQANVNTKADASTVSALSERVSTNETNIATANSRIDEIVAIPPGSTEGNTELIDIRTGADGKKYPTAGDAVRGQVTDLKSDLSDLSTQIIVSGTVDYYNKVEGGKTLENVTFENADTANITGKIISGDKTIIVAPVEPNKTYYYNRVSNIFYNVCLYDEGMNFISTLISAGATNWNKTFVFPPNCKYVAFINDYPSVEPFIGELVNYTKWVDGKKYSSNFKSFVQSELEITNDIYDAINSSESVRPTNLCSNMEILEHSTFENAGTENINGNIISGNDRIAFVKINPWNQYFINQITTYYFDFVFYDANKQYITTAYKYYPSSIGWNADYNYFPENAEYIAFLLNREEPAIVLTKDKNDFSQGKKYRSDIIDTITGITNSALTEKFNPINLVDGGTIYPYASFENANEADITGKIIRSKNDTSVIIVKVNPTKKYWINRLSNIYYNVCLYDENMNFISTMWEYDKTKAWNEIHPIPSNCKYIGFLKDYSQVYPEIIEDTFLKAYKNGKNSIASDDVFIPDNVSDKLNLFLPPDIYVAEGRTIELYNSQVLLNYEKYNVQWVCAIGNAYKRKFSVYGATNFVGNNYALKINVYDDALNLIASAGSTIHIVPNAINSTKRIVMIGDSLSAWDKRQFPEIRLLSDDKIEFVGTKPYTSVASDGSTHSGSTDGRPGFGTADYILGRGSSYFDEEYNTFWDGSKFNFSYYVQYTLNGENPSAVMIWLGTNEIRNLDSFITNMRLIIASIRDYNRNIPVYIVNTVYRSNQDGIGRQGGVEGYHPNSSSFKYQEDKYVFDMMVRVYSEFGNDTNVYCIPLATTHDSEYNYGSAEIDVNPRNSTKVTIPVDSIHPREAGQYQMADVFFSWICGTN